MQLRIRSKLGSKQNACRQACWHYGVDTAHVPPQSSVLARRVSSDKCCGDPHIISPRTACGMEGDTETASMFTSQPRPAQSIHKQLGERHAPASSAAAAQSGSQTAASLQCRISQHVLKRVLLMLRPTQPPLLRCQDGTTGKCAASKTKKLDSRCNKKSCLAIPGQKHQCVNVNTFSSLVSASRLPPAQFHSPFFHWHEPECGRQVMNTRRRTGVPTL